MAAKLVLVATPIGNLGDIGERAIKALNEADFIAAEDTRVTLKLLNHFSIKKELVSYHEHNKTEKGQIICDRLLNGESCALVTDAGMPAISDPGEDLVRLCAAQGIEVTIIPGPCAAVSALAVSGLSSGRFCFESFLSTNKKRRKQHLESLKDETRTIIFNESPHKILYDLKDMLSILGNRRIVLARELTKIHEEIMRTDIVGAINYFEANAAKGEFVLVIEGKQDVPANEFSLQDAIYMAQNYISEGKSVNEASKLVSSKTNIKKSDIYKAICKSK